MKKTFIIVAVFTALLLSGCENHTNNSSAPTPTPTETSSLEPSYSLEKNRLYAILEKTIPDPVITVRENDGYIDLEVLIMDSDDVVDFGTYVLETKAAFETVFAEGERGSYDVLMSVGGDSSSPLYFSSKNYSESNGALCGMYTDARSDNAKIVNINSEEDLFAIFPKARIEASKSQLNQEDVAKYNEVMDALNAEPNRPENEIFAEIAPKYGMTGDELQQFMRDMMGKIY